MQRIVGVIPARLESTRLPRKVLRPLLGRPMLAWVVEAALRCPQLDSVIVATDADEVGALCEAQGWAWQMTSTGLPSGTDRMCAVARTIPADIYVNVQGDEPLLLPEHIDALLRPFERGDHVQATTVRVPCASGHISNPNVVKVVTAPDGKALYFSRATIPYDRDGIDAPVWKHIGLYAYRRKTLERFSGLAAGALERAERLEQLRLLENGVDVYVESVETDTVGVDTEEDVARVEALLVQRNGRQE